MKNNGEKESYIHLNTEFLSIVRREKITFLSIQCKEIEENHRLRNSRDLFMKVYIPREYFMQRGAQ